MSALDVAILGAGGTIAPAIVRDLADSEEVGSMLLVDLVPDRAREVASSHGAGKARARGIDARRNGALAEAIHGCDVLINSASYRINLEAMRAGAIDRRGGAPARALHRPGTDVCRARDPRRQLRDRARSDAGVNEYLERMLQRCE